jgi:hypothetical protein
MKWILAAGMAASVAGCYVVPIDPRLAPNPAVIATNSAPGGVLIPPPQPVPQNLQARLYPINDMAGKMGALTATVVDSVNGHAVFSVPYAGEILQGEASRVAHDYPGFGNIHRQVYGEGRMPSGQRGIASATGAKGTYVNCEYALNAPNKGTGACLFSNGAKFQLHFGS